jgi:REP element-mobilizing transposase RayT
MACPVLPPRTSDTIAGFMEFHRAQLYTAAMPRTIGYHLVKSCYGLWLPGDSRGHWSTAWDEEIGYIEPHKLHEGDPVRKRMAVERMTAPPTMLDSPMIAAVADAVATCASDSDWKVAAAAIESTHMHLLLTYTERDIDLTAKWLAQLTTKAVHRQTPFTGPVWCEGKWLGYIFEPDHWTATREYIERHNVRRGLSSQPWTWITPS